MGEDLISATFAQRASRSPEWSDEVAAGIAVDAGPPAIPALHVAPRAAQNLKMVGDIRRAARAFEGRLQQALAAGQLRLADIEADYAAAALPEAAPRQLDLTQIEAILGTLPARLWAETDVWLVADAGGFDGVDRRPDGALIHELGGGLAALRALALALGLLMRWRGQARALLEPGLADPNWAPDETDLALAWGVDPDALAAADRRMDGALLAALVEPWHLLHLRLHASLLPSPAQAEAATTALLRRLAEMGLLGRPLHLWLGDPVPIDCLSPYTRDLRQPLWQWAQGQPAALGADLTAAPLAPLEATLYAVADDLLATDGRLGVERAAAERSVGIYREQIAGCACAIVDLGRLQPEACDAGLGLRAPPLGQDVLLQLALDSPLAAAASLASLLPQLGDRLRSITVTYEGTLLAGAGPLQLDGILAWDDPAPWSVAGDGLTATATRGLGLAVPSYLAATALTLPQRCPPLRPSGLWVGDTAIWQVLNAARWAGSLAVDVDVAAYLVPAEHVLSGRPTWRTLVSLAAVARLRLRRWLLPGAGPGAVDPLVRSRSAGSASNGGNAEDGTVPANAAGGGPPTAAATRRLRV